MLPYLTAAQERERDHIKKFIERYWKYKKLKVVYNTHPILEKHGLFYIRKNGRVVFIDRITLRAAGKQRTEAFIKEADRLVQLRGATVSTDRKEGK
jgi:hypothetical protein